MLDNESKRTKYSKSGLPDNCPGKFPSPWTPKMTPAKFESQSATDSQEPAAENSKPFDIPATMTPKTPPRSKDDADVTLDLSLPRSASGRYWKDQYDSYSARSESEVKRLIIKQKVAKDYARIKDEEAMGLKAQLDSEQRKRQKREQSLERQVKDMRERLRAALAENAKMSAEVSSLRAELAGFSTELKSNPASQPDLLTKRPTEVPTRSPGVSSRLRRRPNFGATTLGLDMEDIWLDDDADYEDNKRTRLPRRPKSQTSPALNDFIPRLKRNTANSPLASKSPNIESAQSNDVAVIRTLRGKSVPDASVGVSKMPNDMPSMDELMSGQPTTPLGSARRKAARTPDSRRLDGKRLDDAKARVAARRRRRENRAVSR
jgi:Cut12 conserved domain